MYKRFLIAIALIALVSCTGNKSAFDPSNVADAAKNEVTRVEPLSWWVGMKAPLQLLIQGENISEYELSIEGGSGVSVKEIHKADNPNFIFADITIADNAQPGTYYLLFTKGDKCIKYQYQIDTRREGSAERQSFSTADMIYLIMPDRFANGETSNDSTDDTADKYARNELFGRHGGDIQGIIDHLDYIASIGATAIWSTPLLEDNQPEHSYHGYACTDYYHIDSRFGDNELYCKMVEEAHKRDLKIIMDIVPNHCGSAHWWMQDTPFDDWYHKFDTYTGSNICFSSNMDPNASKKDLYIQESGWFDKSMVDMNLNNPYTLKYFELWAIWWIEYANLDGFRVDTYPYNEKEPMAEWCKTIMEEYPNFNIVGECWTASIPQLAYWQGGNDNKDGFNSNLPSIMDFPLRDAIAAALPNNNPGWGQGMTAVYDILSHDFVYHDLSKMMIFAGNHDTDRIGDVVKKDPARLKIANVLLATMRGYPQVFAGDEQMFVSCDLEMGHGGLRVDFPGGWPGDKMNLFTEEGRKAATKNTDGLDVPKGQADELLKHFTTLFQWRKGKEVIHNGKTMHFITRDNTYAFFRYNDTDKVFVYINNSLEPKQIPWDYYSEINEGLGEGREVVSGEKMTITSETVVAPKSAIVVEY